jgi:hypothetical protein
VVNRAVLGFVVDLDLRVVGSQMTLVACLGLSRLGHRKEVPGVAAGAASKTPIRIFAAYSDIRPGSLERPAVQKSDIGSVAGVASRGPFGFVVHPVYEPFVDLVYDPKRIGVLAPGVLLDFRLVALGASMGSDQSRYRHLGVLEMARSDPGRFLFSGFVALGTPHAHLGVNAASPISNQSRFPLFVTLDAACGCDGKFSDCFGLFPYRKSPFPGADAEQDKKYDEKVDKSRGQKNFSQLVRSLVPASLIRSLSGIW